MTRIWFGGLLFVVGGALWLLTRARDGRPGESSALPALVPRFGLALAALGAATMSSTRSELSWLISTICFATVSIILMVSILVEQLRGGRASRGR